MKRALLTASPNGTSQPLVFKGGILYIKDAAKVFNTTEKSIRAKVALHRLPFYKLDGRILFFRDELDQLLRDLQPCVTLDEARENLARRSGERVRR